MGIRVISGDMSGSVQSKAIEVITSAIQAYKGDPNAIGQQIQSRMESEYGGSWCCVVASGSSYTWGLNLRNAPGYRISTVLDGWKVVTFKCP